ncbi:TonB-dependent receptor [Microbulbifer agarilyticus]
MMRKTTLGLKPLVISIAMVNSGAALAQEDAAQERQIEALEEVTVTATRRETNLQETPIAITAVGQDQLTLENINDVSNLNQVVPGLQIRDTGTDGQGSVEINMRGIGNSTYIETGEPNVALNIDGVYTARPQAALQMMYDVQQVEVSRGPQGTLSGRNASIGSINVVTAKPKIDTFEALAEGEFTNENGKAFRSMVNLPIGDTFAIRANYAMQERDSVYTFIADPEVLGGNGLGGGDQQKAYWSDTYGNPLFSGPGSAGSRDNEAFRLSGLWQPTDDFSWRLTYEQYNDGAPGAPMRPDCDTQICSAHYTAEQIAQLDSETWSTVASDPSWMDQEIVNIRSVMEYEIPELINIKHTYGKSDFDMQIMQDLDGGAGIQLVFFDNPWENQAQSHDLTITSAYDSALQWTVGYFNYEEDTQRTFGVDFPRWGYKLFEQPRIGADSEAYYADATFDLNDTVQLFAGYRYSDEKRFNRGGGVYQGGCGVALETEEGFDSISSNPDCLVQEFYGVHTEDYSDYRAGVNWQVTEDVMTYVSVATGHKSGTPPIEIFNPRKGMIESFPVGGEKNTSYEIGAKGNAFDGALSFAAAYFIMDFENKQESFVMNFGDEFCDYNFNGQYDDGVAADTGLGFWERGCGAPGTDFYDAVNAVTGYDDGFYNGGQHDFSEFTTINVEGLDVQGIELEFTWSLTDRDYISGFYTWIDAEFGAYPTDSTIGCNVGTRVCPRNDEQAGNQPKSTPEQTFKITYAHTFEFNSGATLVPTLNAYYRSDYHLTNENLVGRPASFYGLDTGESNLWSDEQDSSVLLSTNVRYSTADGKYEVELFGTNLTNEEVKSHERVDTAGVPMYVYEAPREFGLRGRVRF